MFTAGKIYSEIGHSSYKNRAVSRGFVLCAECGEQVLTEKNYCDIMYKLTRVSQTECTKRSVRLKRNKFFERKTAEKNLKNLLTNENQRDIINELSERQRFR